MSHSYLIYFAISAILFLFLIISIDKYKAELISSVPNGSTLRYFRDLDNDDNSEELSLEMRVDNSQGIIVFSKNKLIDQWNFIGDWANTESLFIADYDNDGVKEIFVFTVFKDSIFLNCLDVINRRIEIENKAVCKVYKRRGGYDFLIFPCTAYDVNADGYKELFFSIQTGFTMYPRNMFAYYPAKDSILVSPESCSSIPFPIMFDFDKDKIPEIIGRIGPVPGNCELDRAYTDQFGWLMVFTPDMEFKFPPVRLNPYPSLSWFIPFNTGENNYILAIDMYGGTENFPSSIALFNSNGKIIRKKNIEYSERRYYSPLFSGSEDYKDIFILGHDSIFRIDSMLNMQFVTKLKNSHNKYIIRKLDIDCDGEDEFILNGKNIGELIIYRKDFSNPVTLQLEENYAVTDNMSVLKKKGDLPKIYICTDKRIYTFSYKSTLLYQYRFALFIPIFLVFIFFHFVIKKIKKYKKLKIESTQKHILSLQLKSIQNQFDPHFTFNIFASFANLITEKDTEQANFVLSKYAGLLRASVINSEKIHLCLQEELDFVERYLELERFMYSNKFSFQINICENIDTQILIPKMLMHIFVENSIKHGLKHIDIGGELLINVTKNNGEVYLSIKDNGVGRVKAKEYGSFSTGKGLGIIDQILEHYYLLNKIRITYKIIDLYENNIAAGTEVKICIPI